MRRSRRILVMATALGVWGAGVAAAGPGAGAAPLAAAANAPGLAFYTYQAPGPASGLTGPAGRVFALTFDDGPDPTWTPQVVSVLQHFGVPGTFFEIGVNVASYPQVTALVAAAGFGVQNHTLTHPDLTMLPASQFPAQIDQTTGLITSITGGPVNCVRPPYDAFNPGVVGQIAARGDTTMSYSVDPRDWTRPGVGAIVSRVLAGAVPGGVVDLHDGGGDRSQTVAALPQIITGLEAAGYRLVPVCGGPAGPPVTGPQASAAYAFGAAPAPSAAVTSPTPLVAATPTAGGLGFWMASADGAVYTSGDAAYLGGANAGKLNRPVVGMAATPDGGGYWLVASDGGIF
ncbi:MAG: polysaccharide deacetylase family protein, partial [Acidimicrobiales bacterium]